MDIPQIDFAAAKALYDDKAAVFLDIRDPGSYQAGHVPGAMRLDDSNVHDFLEETDKAAKIVVYCYHGNSSIGAAGFFMEQGFTDVSSLMGGFTNWSAAGGASESTA